MFGQYNADGTLKEDVQVCALTGRETAPGDAMVRVAGTPYFYRVKSFALAQLTPERRAEIEAAVPKPASSSKSKGE